MQPFRAPRPVQDKSRLELGMGIIDKGMPGSKDKDKDQTQIHDSANKTVSERVISDSEEPTELELVLERSVSERVVSDSEEPTELGLVWERSDMPVDKVGQKNNAGNESTGTASKYWDVEMSTERTTKRLAKEKLINGELDSNNEPFITDNVEGCSEDDVGSEYNGSDDLEHELNKKKRPKRKQSVPPNQKKLKRKKTVPPSVHTVQSVLST